MLAESTKWASTYVSPMGDDGRYAPLLRPASSAVLSGARNAHFVDSTSKLVKRAWVTEDERDHQRDSRRVQMSYLAYTEETHKANGVVRSIVDGICAGMDSAELTKVTEGLLAYCHWRLLRETQVPKPEVAKKKSRLIDDFMTGFKSGFKSSIIPGIEAGLKSKEPAKQKPPPAKQESSFLDDFLAGFTSSAGFMSTQGKEPTPLSSDGNHYYVGFPGGGKVRTIFTDEQFNTCPWVATVMEAIGMKKASKEEYLDMAEAKSPTDDDHESVSSDDDHESVSSDDDHESVSSDDDLLVDTPILV